MSETKQVTKPILDALTDAGYFAMRLNSGVAKKGKYFIYLCPAGTADIVLFMPNKAPVWIETKTVDGYTNPAQVEAQWNFRMKVQALGHLYIRATKLDDVLAAL